jgi:hypothetical protein
MDYREPLGDSLARQLSPGYRNVLEQWREPACANPLPRTQAPSVIFKPTRYCEKDPLGWNILPARLV